jgi:hypothetical protein
MNNPNDFSRDAWNANAENWDERMGDNGNDFSTYYAGLPSHLSLT